EIVRLQGKEIEQLKEKSKELQEQVTKLQEFVYGGRVNHLQRAFQLGIIKEATTVKYDNVVVKVSVQDGRAILLYENKPCLSFYKFLSSVNGQYKKLIIDGISYYDFLNKLKTMEEKISSMSSIPPSTASTARETTLFGDSTTETPLSYESTDPLLSEIITYFISRGFQSSLVRSFLERETHLDLKTNAELMFDFLKERQQLNPTIFVGIEGSGISGVTPGEDKRLLVEWGLTEETANELRDISEGDDLWKKVVVSSRCAQNSEVDDNYFVYGYQLSNPRQILSEWENHGGEGVEDSWQNVIPSARWFEPIKHIQLAVKTRRAVGLMNSYCVGVIYFHTKKPVDQ
ncbi:19557_t:CDS:2, partial [Funneliformis geosporum]